MLFSKRRPWPEWLGIKTHTILKTSRPWVFVVFWLCSQAGIEENQVFPPRKSTSLSSFFCRVTQFWDVALVALSFQLWFRFSEVILKNLPICGDLLARDSCLGEKAATNGWVYHGSISIPEVFHTFVQVWPKRIRNQDAEVIFFQRNHDSMSWTIQKCSQGFCSCC